MEYKFKKGDRVVALRDYVFARKGETYFIGNEWCGNYMSIPLYKDANSVYFICYADGDALKPAENILPQVKIAVHCENQREHETLMRYMDSLGLKCYNTYKPTHDAVMTYAKDNPIIQFHDVFGKCEVNAPLLDGYSIVPFKVFAALKGIDYTPIVEVKLNDTHTATIENGKVKVGCQTFEFERIEALYNAIQEAKK